jgi:hypothetical protein
MELATQLSFGLGTCNLELATPLSFQLATSLSFQLATPLFFNL